MALTEMIQSGNPLAPQQPATPPCSPGLSTPKYSKLGSQAEGPSVLQSAQAPTFDDLKQLNSMLVKVQLSVLAEKSKDGESAAHELGDREIHSTRDNLSIKKLTLFYGEKWEALWVSTNDLPPDSDSGLSDEGFSDTSPNEGSSETSSDENSSDYVETNEPYLDLDLPSGSDCSGPGLAET